MMVAQFGGCQLRPEANIRQRPPASKRLQLRRRASLEALGYRVAVPNAPLETAAEREHDRFAWIWGPLAAIALWWPAHIRGILDGAPLDRPLEAILLGLAFPALWWLHPAFLRQLSCRVLIALLLLTKTTASLLAPAGWCVRFDPPAPIVRDSTGGRTAGTSAPTGCRR